MKFLSEPPFCLTEDEAGWVRQTLASMSLEKKLGQLFHLITYSDDPSYLSYLCRDIGIGGCMVRTMPTAELVRTVNRMQELAEIPLLISANLEAGFSAAKEGTRIGSGLAVAATGDARYAAEMGRAIAEEANACGVNYAFAPLLDIDRNWQNPITNTRTFGSDSETVAEMGAAYVKALQAGGLAAAVKHFPGDGQDFRDQHLVASVNGMECEEWMRTYGEAYRRSIEAGALTVMVGHILLPSFSRALCPGITEGEIRPALIAPELLGGLLRSKLGFQGMIITDSSTMAGMGTALPRHRAVPETIAAGCDMFLFTKNLEEDLGFMRRGIETGIISGERLDDAVAHILALKAKLRLPARKRAIDPDEAIRTIGSPAHHALAREIADRSITLVKEEAGTLPLSPEKYPRVLLYGLESGIGAVDAFGRGKTEPIAETLKKEFESRGYRADIFRPVAGFEGMAMPVSAIVGQYDLIVYGAVYATKSNQTTVRIEWMEPFGANVPVYFREVPTIFISFENPYHLADVPRVPTYINTYGRSPEILASLFERLEGRAPFTGVSPVDAFCGLWDAHLS